jgi:uncharacterized protein (DUF302 family)
VNEGLVTIASQFSVKETIDRLVAKVTSVGLHVFARVDHGGGAKQAGFDLRPTELLLFGNPRGGTPLMLDKQSAGIDLPVKALAWEDAAGKVWLTYNDAAWIADRHALSEASAEAVRAMTAGLATVTKAAAEA